MPEKLLDMNELSSYLDISESEIRKLVDEHVIPAYRLGGSFLRFRKEQIDAIKNEILLKKPHITPTYKVKLDIANGVAKVESTETISDKILDLFYFSDFYIICALLITIMLIFIVRM